MPDLRAAVLAAPKLRFQTAFCLNGRDRVRRLGAAHPTEGSVRAGLGCSGRVCGASHARGFCVAAVAWAVGKTESRLRHTAIPAQAGSFSDIL